MDRQFASLGAERESAGSDDVTDIKRFKLGKHLLAQIIFADIDLNPPLAIL